MKKSLILAMVCGLMASSSALASYWHCQELNTIGGVFGGDAYDNLTAARYAIAACQLGTPAGYVCLPQPACTFIY